MSATETIRTEASTEQYAIIVPRDGRLKYVGRWYKPRKDYGYTIKVNEAMTFNTLEAVRKAMENFGLHGSVGKIRKHIELVEVM